MAFSPPRADRVGGAGGGVVASGGATDNGKAAHDKQVRIESDVRASAVHGHHVWLAHNDGSISIRKVRTTEVVATVPFMTNRGRPWALLPVEVPGSRPSMWVGYSTGDISVLDIETRRELKMVCRHTGGVYCLSEFGGTVFSGSNDFEIVQWRASDVSFVRQLNGHSNYVRALHAEGSVVISGSDDHTVRVWNATNGQLVSIGRFHRVGVSALCRVGDSMWSGDDDGGIVVWRLRTLEQEELLNEHTGRINGLKKIGGRIYSASADHTVGVWDAVARTIVARINEHRGWVMNLVAPAQLTRYYVWTAAADSTVRCWHHDEYKACTRDVERFNDIQWFNTEYSPYRELNDELAGQVARLEAQSAHLLEAYTTDHAHIENCTTQVGMMKDSSQAAEEEAERCRLQLRECTKRLEGVQTLAASKEKELVELAEATKAARGENVDLRCESERLKAENEQLTRQLALCVSQRDKLDVALKETLALREAKGEVCPVIVTTTGQTADELVKAHAQVKETMALNETLREDLDRLSRVVAAATTSNVAAYSHGNRMRNPRPSESALGRIESQLGLLDGHQNQQQRHDSFVARPPGSPNRRPSSAARGMGSSRRKSSAAAAGGGDDFAASTRAAASANYTGGAGRQFARNYVMDRYLTGKK